MKKHRLCPINQDECTSPSGDKLVSSESPTSRTSRATKFQPRRIGNLRDERLEIPPFIAEEDLREGLAARTKVPKNKLNGLDFSHPAPLLDSGEEMRR
jgi:hypothetical protein